MRKKVNDTMEDNLGWLQHLVDDPCLKNKTQKKYFFSLYIPFLHNPITSGHVTSPIKSILIEK